MATSTAILQVLLTNIHLGLMWANTHGHGSPQHPQCPKYPPYPDAYTAGGESFLAPPLTIMFSSVLSPHHANYVLFLLSYPSFHRHLLQHISSFPKLSSSTKTLFSLHPELFTLDLCFAASSPWFRPIMAPRSRPVRRRQQEREWCQL